MNWSLLTDLWKSSPSKVSCYTVLCRCMHCMGSSKKNLDLIKSSFPSQILQHFLLPLSSSPWSVMVQPARTVITINFSLIIFNIILYASGFSFHCTAGVEYHLFHNIIIIIIVVGQTNNSLLFLRCIEIFFLLLLMVFVPLSCKRVW